MYAVTPITLYYSHMTLPYYPVYAAQVSEGEESETLCLFEKVVLAFFAVAIRQETVMP